MSQGVIQFSQGMNNVFLRSAAAENPGEQEVDPQSVADEFFRSEYYDGAKGRLRTMFSDTLFWPRRSARGVSYRVLIVV